MSPAVLIVVGMISVMAALFAFTGIGIMVVGTLDRISAFVPLLWRD